MNRRGFFGTVLGGFVAAILPWPKPARKPTKVWLLNSDQLTLRIADNPIYGFGFSGFQVGDEDKIKGVIAWEVTPTWPDRAFAVRQHAAL